MTFMYHKHDQIQKKRNPYKRPEPKKYVREKYYQKRIYFKCEKEKNIDKL